MNCVIPYTKEIKFDSKIKEITSISLEHELSINDTEILGNFLVNGEYKTHELSVNKEKFDYTLPFSIDIPENLVKDSIKFNITDFSYEILNETVLKVMIEFTVTAQEEEKKEEIFVKPEEDPTIENEIVMRENESVEEDIVEEKVDENDSKKFLKIKKDMKGDDDEPEVNKDSYDKLDTVKNKVEDLKDKLNLPKEFLDNKKVNFGFSFSVNDAGLKIDFHDENHNSMSQTFIDFNKNDFDSINQMVSKYVTALSMLMLNFNKINVNEKTINK